ncbi:MAG: restriction endonuclease subunit S [Spirochaetales bacterium]|nr:restriction endonuclease subunit S [Spirochaetales bacterium]
MREDWENCELEDICQIISGRSQKDVVSDDGKFPIYGSSGVIGRATEYICEEGTTVIGRKGTINSPIFVSEKFWNIDTAFGLTPSEIVDDKFLFYFCVSFNFFSLDKSTTIPSLARRDLLKIEFSLPSLPEQRAIVAKIEALFSDLDKGIADLEKAREQLKIYRQAVLKKAFEGDYETRKISKIAEVNTGATPKRGTEKYWKDGEIPWITSGALNKPYVDVALENITECALKETNCKIIPKGSLLIAMYGEGKTRGKCSELTIDAAVNQAIATVTLSDSYQEYKTYLKWFFVMNYEAIRLLSSGGVQPNLNLTIIKNTIIPFPSETLKKQIVKEIESRLSVCDKMEESISESLEKAEALRQSILKKAFEGKLLSHEELEKCRQAADFEPASVLLERIKVSEAD